MPDTSCVNEDINILKISQNAKDIHGIGIRTTANEKDIKNLQLNTALSDQKFEMLLDQLSGVPQTMIDMKNAMVEMQTENRELIMSIQNDNKNTNVEVMSLKNELMNLKSSTQKEIKGLRDELNKVEDKGKFDFLEFVKGKLVPALIGGGAIYLIWQIVNNVSK